MPSDLRLEPTVMMIAGASGDLTGRKIIPAIYDLFLDRWLPDLFRVIGISRTPMESGEFRRLMREGVDKFSRRGKTSDREWEQFAEKLSYRTAEYHDTEAYATLLEDADSGWGRAASKIVYLATPPSLVPEIVTGLAKAEELRGHRACRIVVEKPFGRNLATAKALNKMLRQSFDENRIYRMDHYLGKETVQNILAFRFANSMWEPVWNRSYIDHVQITVSEQIGVGRRGGYFDQAGALRDMIQNHLLQLMCLVAMEPPINFQADEVRNKKVEVLNAVRAILPEQVSQVAVRGQYGANVRLGDDIIGYRDEPGIKADSGTETFAAIKLYIDNWRWQGVPFYLRTGKRLPARTSEISLQFRPVPHHPFSENIIQPNRLAIQIEPEEGILLRTQVKEPGMGMKLKPVELHFTYREVFHAQSPDAYETLLLDIIRGDSGLFMRSDQVEAAWSVLEPVLQDWEENPPKDFPNYAAGEWGPPAAEELVARDGRNWLLPACLEARAGQDDGHGTPTATG